MVHNVELTQLARAALKAVLVFVGFMLLMTVAIIITIISYPKVWVYGVGGMLIAVLLAVI
jgi:hypothetical protein